MCQKPVMGYESFRFLVASFSFLVISAIIFQELTLPMFFQFEFHFTTALLPLVYLEKVKILVFVGTFGKRGREKMDSKFGYNRLKVGYKFKLLSDHCCQQIKEQSEQIPKITAEPRTSTLAVVPI